MDSGNENSRSDIHEITHALEAAGFEVYGVENELDYNWRTVEGIATGIPTGVLKIKAKRRANGD
jgi:hypothetical protein